mgnify:CR=1 FL=1
MTCTTFDKHCDTAHSPDCRAAERQSTRLADLISRLGEQLFHYRYVRAELIDRALERPSDRRKSS